MLQEHTHQEISNAIIRSQHTQRNYDLSKKIPEDDIKLLVKAVTECPSKQNIAYYKVHFVEDRDLIEDIHELTRGFTTRKKGKNSHPSGAETNTQILANLLVIFERHLPNERLVEEDAITAKSSKPIWGRNTEARYFLEHGNWENKEQLNTQVMTSVGIAAGYLNLTASLLGYRTGCCQCMDAIAVQKVAVLKDRPLLLMGVGYHNVGVNRRKHHIRDDFIFLAKKKMPIEVEFWR